MLDRESCYRAVKARDRRFDGVFYTAVRTTGIYCRPSCPARTPELANVRFHPSAAAAQAAGFRACKRCLPGRHAGQPGLGRRRRRRRPGDAADRRRRGRPRGRRRASPPGSATRRATSTGCSPPSSGAGPARPGPRPARADRAGAASRPPTLSLRRHRVRGRASPASASSTTRSARCTPPRRPSCAVAAAGSDATGADHDAAARVAHAVRRRRALLDFLAVHVVAGVEAAGAGLVRPARSPCRTARHRPARASPHAAAAGETAFVDRHLRPRPTCATLTAGRRADPAAARRRLRPGRGRPTFAGDPVIGPLVRGGTGLRVPGHVDGDELAVRARARASRSRVGGARTLAGAAGGRARPTGRTARAAG